MIYFKKFVPRGIERARRIVQQAQKQFSQNANFGDDPVVVAIAKEMEDALQGLGVWDYSKVYVGITNSSQRRLFEEHNVDENNGAWVVYDTGDKAIAEKVEEYLLKRGMKGAPGGGNDDSVYVYCYKITPSTLQ